MVTLTAKKHGKQGGGAMGKMRRFRFKGLPKYSTAQVAVLESFSEFLGREPLQKEFIDSLCDELKGYLRSPVKLSQPDLNPLSTSGVTRILPHSSCMLVVGAAPTEHKLIIDLDPVLAAQSIDRLLGGEGKVSAMQRPLTQIEQGVLSFLILKVLSRLQSGWRHGNQLSLSLDRFASSMADLEELLRATEGYQMLAYRIALGKQVGYLRVFVPSGLVRQHFSLPPSQGPASDEELTHMRQNLNSLGMLEVFGRIEVGQLDLEPDDIAQLEDGDIVILDRHQVKLTSTGLAGEAFVHIGTGLNGGLRGQLFHEGEYSKLRITEIVIQEQPVETVMADGMEPEDNSATNGATPDMDSGEGLEEALEQAIEAAPEDNFAETEGLLRDVPAPVVVELGRVKLNTNQIIRMREGQVLRLPRGPNDPVNLVVAGKLFARGDLIEVDGELGVRLTHVLNQ